MNTPADTAPAADPASPGDESATEEIAQLVAQALRQQLHADFDQVKVLSVERVEWPDACLGVEIEGQACPEVISPGYRVVLEVVDRRYEFHVDELGSDILLADAPPIEVLGAAVIWEGELRGRCHTATLGSETAAVGLCGGPQIAGQYGLPERAEAFTRYVGRYAPFEVETLAGQVTFVGRGTEAAGPGVRRMVAEWARLAALEALAGRSGASYGLALAWHREGGIAGFCDDLTVYVTGEIWASTCSVDPPRSLGHGWLTEDQAVRLFIWVDGLQAFEWSHTDPATADAMTMHITFSGLGRGEAGEAEIQAIGFYAAERFAELQQ